MRASEVQYMFRATYADLTAAQRKVNSLIEGGIGAESLPFLLAAQQYLGEIAAWLSGAQKAWEKEGLPHRRNAGELD